MIFKNKILLLALAAIFLFWFLLAKDNYFHMDDWEWVKMYEKGFWTMIMTPRDGEHFVPLAGIVFYTFFKLFGFSYIPFQLFNSLVHTINALLLYKIINHETKNSKLALAATLLFGLASTAPDVLVWGNSFLINTSGLFFFLGYYLFLLYTKEKKSRYLVISVLCFLASPRFQTITTIVPFALAVVAVLRMKKKNAYVPAIIYCVAGVTNIVVTFTASPHALAEKSLQIAPDLLTQVPIYIFWGIYKGTFLRLITPDLYLLKNITHLTQPIRIFLAIIIPVFAIFAFGQIRLNKRLLMSQKIPTYISYLLLLSVTYLMIAPFRVHNGIMQATIPRYTYTCVFFMIILFSVMYDSFYGKVGKIPTFLIIVLLCLHAVANYNFNAHWHLNTEKDREFTSDVRYLLDHNSEVFDFPIHGIWNINVSDVDVLLAPNRYTTFYPLPFDASRPFYMDSDDTTKQIYEELQTDYAVYNPPFHVPYSM